jgi:periplasmic divalent cation tolerance protein
MTDRFVLLYMTAPDAETAQRIAEALVEARLAACANIFPGMRSIYRWQGVIETAEEVAAIFKTAAALAEAACALIVRLHPSDLNHEFGS